MRRIVLAQLIFSVLVYAKVQTNQVLAVVAGEAITHRYLQIESALDDPANFDPQGELDFSSTRSQRLLQQLVIRAMVSDENRVLKVYQISRADLDKRFQQFKNNLGTKRYETFLEKFRLSEADVRLRLEAWIVLEKTIAEQEDVETWLKRLRARHNIVFYKNS